MRDTSNALAILSRSSLDKCRLSQWFVFLSLLIGEPPCGLPASASFLYTYGTLQVHAIPEWFVLGIQPLHPTRASRHYRRDIGPRYSIGLCDGQMKDVLEDDGV